MTLEIPGKNYQAENQASSETKKYYMICDGYFYNPAGEGKIIFFSDTACLEASQQYAKVHALNHDSMTLGCTLSRAINDMKVKLFYRSHDSWYVNMELVKQLEKQTYKYAGRYITMINDYGEAKCQKKNVVFFESFLEQIRLRRCLKEKYPMLQEKDLALLKNLWIV